MVSGALALLWLAVVIAFIYVLAGRYRLSVFPVLLCAAIGYGLLIGLSPQAVLVGVQDGFGGTLANIGIVMMLTAMTGIILEKTGAAASVARAATGGASGGRLAWIVNLLGFGISIPVYGDVGYLTLLPVNKALARGSDLSFPKLCLAYATGMYVSSALLIPAPAALASAQALSADMGRTFLVGLAASVPALIAGFLWIWRHNSPVESITRATGASGLTSKTTTRDSAPDGQGISAGAEVPSLWASSVPILLPLVLITFRTVAGFPSRPLGNGSFYRLAQFLGHPVMATLLGFFCSLFLVRRRHSRVSLDRWFEEAIARVAPMVVAAALAGALAQIIKAGPLMEFVTTAIPVVQGSGKFFGLLLFFLMAALLKTIQGSSLVAVILASGVAAPLLETFGVNPALATAAIGSGAMMVSHANDPFFWILQKSSGMSVGQTSRTWTVATAIEGCVAFLVVCLIAFFFK